MKRLLQIIVFTSILTSCGGSEPSNSEEKSNSEETANIYLSDKNGKTTQIRNIEIAKKDFPKMMYWEDANKACQELGDGWRLPTLAEFDEIYKNKEDVGFNGNGGYWSSSEFGEVGKEGGAWCFYFVNGSGGGTIKENYCYVRAVRSL